VQKALPEGHEGGVTLAVLVERLAVSRKRAPAHRRKALSGEARGMSPDGKELSPAVETRDGRPTENQRRGHPVGVSTHHAWHRVPFIGF
jgi:hypothetical protein